MDQVIEKGYCWQRLLLWYIYRLEQRTKAQPINAGGGGRGYYALRGQVNGGQ